MGQILHGSATTTEAVRRAIHNSQESLRDMGLQRRFTTASTAGAKPVWDRLMDAIIKAHDGKVQMIDSTSVRVHQQAAAQKNRLETLVSVEVVGD